MTTRGPYVHEDNVETECVHSLSLAHMTPRRKLVQVYCEHVELRISHC